MRDTCAPSNNLPTPLPGVAASLLIRARLDFFCRTSSSSNRSGVPTPIKPPTMMVAPSGIIAMASSAETDFMLEAPVDMDEGRDQSAVAVRRCFDLHQGSARGRRMRCPPQTNAQMGKDDGRVGKERAVSTQPMAGRGDYV